MDQEAIYAKYIPGFVAGKKIRSPFPWRTDSHPSFSTKWYGDWLCWYDFGHTNDHIKDVIGFVACYHGETRDEAKARIKGFGGSLTPAKRSFKDRVSSIRLPFFFDYGVLRDEHLRYFKTIGVDEAALVKYNVHALNSISKKGRKFMTSTVDNLGFHWTFGRAEKGYFPFERPKRKFWHENVDELEGYEQLDFSRNDLIFTKSMKDILTLYCLGYNPISSSGEGSLNLIADRADELSKFKRVWSWGDPDEQGEKYTEGIKEIFGAYDREVLKVVSVGGKDPSDILARHQEPKLIHNLIKNAA